MDINATIIGQLITFAILVWFTMRYVWPPVIKAIHEREKKIAAGLDAAERSKQELEVAEHKAISIIRDAKQQASHIIEQANFHSAQLIEEAKSQAKEEGLRIVSLAEGEINREITQARAALKDQVVKLALAGAEKIIRRNLDPAAHHDLLKDLVEEI